MRFKTTKNSLQQLRVSCCRTIWFKKWKCTLILTLTSTTQTRSQYIETAPPAQSIYFYIKSMQNKLSYCTSLLFSPLLFSPWANDPRVILEILLWNHLETNTTVTIMKSNHFLTDVWKMNGWSRASFVESLFSGSNMHIFSTKSFRWAMTFDLCWSGEISWWGREITSSTAMRSLQYWPVCHRWLLWQKITFHEEIWLVFAECERAAKFFARSRGPPRSI